MKTMQSGVAREKQGEELLLELMVPARSHGSVFNASISAGKVCARWGRCCSASGLANLVSHFGSPWVSRGSAEAATPSQKVRPSA